MAILVAASLCGVVSIIGAAVALLKGWRPAVHVVAASRVISVALGIPSIFSQTVENQVRTFAIFSIPMGILALFLLYHDSITRRVFPAA